MRKFIQIILFVSSVVFGKTIWAQQDPMYSMYMFDKMLINPAFTGSSDWAIGTIKYREQYSGLEGHPTTKTFNFHTPIANRFVGLGIKVISDKIAVMENLNVSLLYSYHLNFASGKLSFGIETGLYSRKINYGELVLSTQYDNSLPVSTESSVVPDAGWGFYYQKKQLYFGFSQVHLIKSNFKDSPKNESQSHLYNHINFMLGNVFNVNKKVTVEPSVLLKYVPSTPIQLDLNAMIYYNDRIGVGIQYRTGDAVVAILKINIIEQLRIAYSYDMTISGLSGVAGSTHEIILSYGIKLPPTPTRKEVHPRYYF